MLEVFLVSHLVNSVWIHIIFTIKKKNFLFLKRLMTTEAYTDLNFLTRYYGNTTRLGAQIPFYFALMFADKHNMIDFMDEYIFMWLNAMPEKMIANWVVRWNGFLYI